MHEIKAGVPNIYIGICAPISSSVYFSLKTHIWSSCRHHITVTDKCISLKLVCPINILEPVHACQYHCAFKKQAIPPSVCLKKIWFSRKSRRACASQSSARCAKHKKLPRWHRIVQSTKLFKAQNRSKHKIVQNTKLCKAQICAKHKILQSTKLFNACVKYLNTCVQIGALSIV